MPKLAERRKDSSTMTCGQESQLREHEAWLAKHLAASDVRPAPEVGAVPPHLRESWIEVDLIGKDLRRADFRQVAAMRRAKFDGADLRGAEAE